MSVLAYPRIHFQGKCLINAATGNNDDVMDNVDSVNVRLLPPLNDLSDAAARAWLIEGVPAISPINQKLFTYVRSGWDYFGDLSVQFQDTTVCSVVGTDGRRSRRDPIVGEPVQIVGSHGTKPVICAVDSTGAAAAQIIVGGFVLGDDELGLSATYETRAFNRWIVWRNAQVYQGEQNFVGAGATWQFAIPRGDPLRFSGSEESPALAELAAAEGRRQGILVQFCFYLPEPQISDSALIELFHDGCDSSNPAEAFLVGTIGVWEDGELGTVFTGRLLQAPPDAEDPLSNVLPYPLGPAAARVHPGHEVVSLNLITTFPEANYDRPPTRKAYIGPVRLGLIPPSSDQAIPISKPFPYGYASYEESGGIVDVPYDPGRASPEALRDGALVLLADRYAKPYWGPAGKPRRRHWRPILTEAYSIRTVDSDDGAVYLDVGKSQQIALLVRERGGPPSSDVTISLWEYQFVVIPPGFQQRAHSELTLVGPGTPLVHRIEYPAAVVFPAGQAVPYPVPIRGCLPGPLTLAFTLTGQPPEPGFPTGAVSFTGVRVLPVDTFPKDSKPSWDFMYQNVFRYYNLTFPAMSKVIPLDNQAAMEAAAPEIVRRTDPALRHSTRYMPITRDLSSGKRDLIVKWAHSLPKGP
jgi:hypothetical protein